MSKPTECSQYYNIRSVIAASLYLYVYKNFDFNNRVKLTRQTASWKALSHLLAHMLIDVKCTKVNMFEPLDIPKINIKKHTGKIIKGNKR